MRFLKSVLRLLTGGGKQGPVFADAEKPVFGKAGDTEYKMRPASVGLSEDYNSGTEGDGYFNIVDFTAEGSGPVFMQTEGDETVTDKVYSRRRPSAREIYKTTVPYNPRYSADPAIRYAAAYRDLLRVAEERGITVYELTPDQMTLRGYVDKHGPKLGWRKHDTVLIDGTEDSGTMAITAAHEIGAGRNHINSEATAQITGAELFAGLGYRDFADEMLREGRRKGILI